MIFTRWVLTRTGGCYLLCESRGTATASDSESIAIFVFDVSVSYATSDDRSASLGQHVKHVRASVEGRAG